MFQIIIALNDAMKIAAVEGSFNLNSVNIDLPCLIAEEGCQNSFIQKVKKINIIL